MHITTAKDLLDVVAPKHSNIPHCSNEQPQAWAERAGIYTCPRCALLVMLENNGRITADELKCELMVYDKEKRARYEQIQFHRNELSRLEREV